MPSVSVFPAIIPSASEMGIVSNTKQFISPLTGYTQTTSRRGARWFLRMSFLNLRADERGVLKGLLGFMEGQVNRIQVGDHSYTGARGALGGTPLVSGGNQVGSTLVTSGWPNSTVVLKAGDLISFSNGTYSELKQVTTDITSSASGTASITINPEIHKSPASSASIETANPVGTFMLANPVVNWTNRPSQISGVSSPSSDISIDLIEDIGT